MYCSGQHFARCVQLLEDLTAEKEVLYLELPRKSWSNAQHLLQGFSPTQRAEKALADTAYGHYRSDTG